MGDAALQPAIVYLALEQDSPAVSLALRLRTMLGSEETPIVICMKSDLSKLMEGDEFPFTATRAIHAFNILDFACAFPVLLDEVTDEMARSIHCAYVISLIRFSGDRFHLLHSATTDRADRLRVSRMDAARHKPA